MNKKLSGKIFLFVNIFILLSFLSFVCGCTKRYKVTFIVDNETYKTVEVKKGNTIEKIEAPTKENHYFKGWFDENNLFDFSTSIKKDYNLVAKYDTFCDVDGHDWIDATCTTTKYCQRCGETEGVALGHIWKEATSQTPKTCTRCGVTEGDPLPEVESIEANYTMESFVEGGCNRLAKSAGMAIGQNPGGTAFNPLLIYGGSGLGKTHLAQAIGLEVKQNFPEKIVLYVSTNLFQTQFTEAVRKNEINDFLHFYQLIDVLILDDIHELAGKTATQNTFFHIFNHLQQLGKQLILTCDKAPAELSGIEDRLLSRFKWGLSAEIKSPDFETRKEIVLYKAKKDGIEFSDDVIAYICKFVNNNVRELEGAMISLLAQATFNKKDLTVELVRDILGKMVRKQATEDLTVDKIQQVICTHFHIEPEALQAKTRKREVVQARQLAMYFCKNYTKASLSFIGNQIGKKDHATVLYACKAVTDLMETDRKFRIEVEEIQKKLYCSN